METDLDEYLDSLPPSERERVMAQWEWIATVQTETKLWRALLIVPAMMATFVLGILAFAFLFLFPPFALVLFVTAGAPTWYAWRWARPQTVVEPKPYTER